MVKVKNKDVKLRRQWRRSGVFVLIVDTFYILFSWLPKSKKSYIKLILEFCLITMTTT